MPYPALQNFDSPTGDISCPRRNRSNTPLQALTTLNEELFVDCARALAAKIVTDGGESDSDRVNYAVRRCLAREPNSAELTTLKNFLHHQRRRFTDGSADPWPLISDDKPPHESGESVKLPANAQPAELAAWTALARVVLNLDETITKE